MSDHCPRVPVGHQRRVNDGTTVQGRPARARLCRSPARARSTPGRACLLCLLLRPQGFACNPASEDPPWILSRHGHAARDCVCLPRQTPAGPCHHVSGHISHELPPMTGNRSPNPIYRLDLRGDGPGATATRGSSCVARGLRSRIAPCGRGHHQALHAPAGRRNLSRWSGARMAL